MANQCPLSPLIQFGRGAKRPIVQLSGKQNNVEFEQTVFGWSEGFKPDADLYAYVRLRMHTPAGTELPTQNYGLPDQGTFLIALAEHYELTGDHAWLQSVSESLVRAGDWILKRRASAPRTGLTKGLIFALQRLARLPNHRHDGA